MHNLAQAGALNGAPQICELPLVYLKKIEAKKKTITTSANITVKMVQYRKLSKKLQFLVGEFWNCNLPRFENTCIHTSYTYIIEPRPKPKAT